MNQRESSGLPLRAMVMVLLFLGVVFLLVAFQSLSSDSSSESSSSSSSASATSATATTSATPAPAKADVKVFNISEVAGAAQIVANKLHDQQWNVTETDNLSVDAPPPATTVYFGDAAGEKEAAEAVGKILDAPVEPRIPALNDKGPGVIVLVTG
ncbi:LytR C-terminal domain-containing protein [Mycolicibacterium sp. CBMA 226]|uniref:LytR C-terminal domain-containing protein n=1 Tax=Mycolicibacterium sp. CBMA 226 TaxID=2606611 RepID=UPI0012DF2878|nr:LytR C-terminal domain-containing protein [Mycolicibacterium sp. CBMA 226]MUL76624.1 LytR family transcriptional regulator [Mycolicibacterium sp. CBMA 226]